MPIPRKITRGLGEKTQTKELRRSVYPQTGLAHQTEASPVDTTVTPSGQVVAIRTASFDRPRRIDGTFGHANNTINVFALPYLNLSVGAYGRGFKPYYWNPTSINQAQGTQYLPVNSNVGHSFLLTTYFAVYSYTLTSVINKVLSSTYSGEDWFNGISFTQYSLRDYPQYPYHETRQGGVFTSQPFIFGRNQSSSIVNINGRGNIVTRMNTALAVFAQRTFGQPVSRRFIVSGVEPFYIANYYRANTNQKNNSRWLVGQRTQYQTKFDRLQLIGV